MSIAHIGLGKSLPALYQMACPRSIQNSCIKDLRQTHVSFDFKTDQFKSLKLCLFKRVRFVVLSGREFTNTIETTTNLHI